MNCPTHNVALEKRTGKYGDFFGCPMYATEGCKFVYREGKPTAKKPEAKEPSRIEEKLDEIIKLLREILNSKQSNG